MNDGPIVRRISFDIHGEFITQLAREWFYTGEKSHEKVIEILMDSMTGTDTPEAQIRRYAEDILLGRAALKGSTAAGTYHLETYEPGEEEQMPKSMNIWKEVERRKKAEKDLRRMIERWDVAMDHISESTQRAIRKELGEETAEDRQQDALDSFMARMMDEEEHTTEDYGWLERNLPCSRVGRSSGMGERLSGQEPDTRGTVCGDGGDQRIRNGEKFPGCYRSGGLSGQKRMGASAQSTAGNRNSNKGHHQRVHEGAERVPV